MRVFSKFTTIVYAISVLCCSTSEAFTMKRSESQLVIEADMIIKEMEGAKLQGSCIGDVYRKTLLTMSTNWMKAANELQNTGDRPITSRKNDLHELINSITNRPICPQYSSQKAQTDTSSSVVPGSITLLGSNAGDFAANSTGSIFAGVSAGREAKASNYSTMVGYTVGYSLKTSPYASLFGASAGEVLENAPFSVALGSSAGRLAKNADYTIFLGSSAGYEAQDIDFSMLFGYAAGRSIKNNKYSIIAGYAAGEYAHRSDNSLMNGAFAGYQAEDSSHSVMIGRDAGMFANKAPSSIMIGFATGRGANNTKNSVFIGKNAGKTAAQTKDVVLIGTSTDAEPGIENAVGIGRGANPSRSNTWHIPDPLNVGIGTSAPIAQLHTTRNVIFAGLPNGVLITDKTGNVSASPLLNDALQQIAILKARLDALEAKKCHP